MLAAARREALQRHRSRRASQRGLHVQCQAAGLAAEHAAPGPQQRPSSGRLLALIAGAAVLAYHCAPARQSTALFAAIQATAAPLAHKGVRSCWMLMQICCYMADTCPRRRNGLCLQRMGRAVRGLLALPVRARPPGGESVTGAAPEACWHSLCTA